MYDARQIANWFISRARSEGVSLSIMSLLKLTYIAHGWRLEMTGQPLINNRIEAWRYGPVIPDVYNSLRHQGVNVQSTVPNFPDVLPDNDAAFLEEIWKIYGSMSAFQLYDLTHEQGGPWDVASQVGGNYAHIPDNLIKSHYEKKRLQARERAAS